MIDAAAVESQLDGWVIEVVPDESALVDVFDDETGETRQVHPDVIVAAKGDMTLRYSPTHDVDELVNALAEHDKIAAHDAGEHTEPVWGCPECVA